MTETTWTLRWLSFYLSHLFSLQAVKFFSQTTFLFYFFFHKQHCNVFLGITNPTYMGYCGCWSHMPAPEKRARSQSQAEQVWLETRAILGSAKI